jgi:alpha-beta hydrolase superfamily lysophospholipase
MKNREGHFQGAGDAELYYQWWQPAGKEKAVICFVHGYGDHSSRHGNLVSALSKSGFSLYAFDLRGHGRSPGKRGHIDSWAQFREDLQRLLRLVEAQSPDLPLFLMGYSLGGLIAADYALHNPGVLKGLVLMAPGLDSEDISAFAIMMARIFSRILPRLGINPGLDDVWVSRDEKVLQEMADDPLCHGTATARLGNEVLKTMDWCQQNAGTLKTPVLVLHGKDDHIMPADTSRVFFENIAFSDKKRIEYDGGYHELDNDVNHQEVLGDLVRWLEDHL